MAPSDFEHFLSRDEVEAQLREQIQFLRTSAAAYDAGNLAEAKRLSTATYILLHDATGRIKSLVSQLELRDRLRFVSTAVRQDSDYGLPLARVGCPEDAVSPSFVPLLGGGRAPASVDFSSWWNEVIFAPSGAAPRSRKDIVLTMRDTDGGAHSDAARRDGAYHSLVTDGAKALKFAATSEGYVHVVAPRPGWAVLAKPPPDAGQPSFFHVVREVPLLGALSPPHEQEQEQSIGGGHLATMRQIAWELEIALQAVGY